MIKKKRTRQSANRKELIDLHARMQEKLNVGVPLWSVLKTEVEAIIAEKNALKSKLAETALHRAADFPEDRLPDRLKEWLAELRDG